MRNGSDKKYSTSNFMCEDLGFHFWLDNLEIIIKMILGSILFDMSDSWISIGPIGA
jgi:hypothetical protein